MTDVADHVHQGVVAEGIPPPAVDEQKLIVVAAGDDDLQREVIGLDFQIAKMVAAPIVPSGPGAMAAKSPLSMHSA
jgi:hypothetical protein